MSDSLKMPRHYLDNAATSFPKPPSVHEAVRRAMVELGAPAGRGTYSEAVAVEREILATRRALAELFGVDDPRRFAFFLNGTDALNQALFGTLKPGDRVVTSTFEHNSVLRPLARLRDERGVQVAYVDPDASGALTVDRVRAALPRGATHLVLTAASNVTGAIQPIDEIAAFAQERGLSLIVDAAQAVGHLPLRPAGWGRALVAFSGHKGLLGPLGTGALWVSPDWEGPIAPLRLGGSGFRSEDEHPPSELPQRLEAGNLNVPGILGLGAGVEYLKTRGIQDIQQHGERLCQRLLDGLAEIAGVRVGGPRSASERVPVVSIVVEGFDPQEIALGLDAVYRIQTRPGLHCAPRIHEALGTQALGGTVRFSLGPYTTDAEIDCTVAAVAELASSEVIG